MKRMLSSFSLFGSFRKRQKLGTEKKDDEVAGSENGSTTTKTTSSSDSSRQVESHERQASTAQASTICHHRSLLQNGEEPCTPGGWPSEFSDTQTEPTANPADLQERVHDESVSDSDVSPPTEVTSARDLQLTPRGPSALRAIYHLTGYQFRDISLLTEAFYIGIPAIIGGRFVSEGNLRLACVGDRALALVWWDAWYSRAETRGLGSERFKRASANRELAAVGFYHGLDVFVTDHSGFIWRDLPVKRMADTVEAIIGAIWLDSRKDLGAVKNAMVGLIGQRRVDSAFIPQLEYPM